VDCIQEGCERTDEGENVKLSECTEGAIVMRGQEYGIIIEYVPCNAFGNDARVMFFGSGETHWHPVRGLKNVTNEVIGILKEHEERKERA